MKDSIFTKIINREIEAFIIEENEYFIAILDAFPLVKGHTLIIPKQQIDYIFDMDDELLANFHIFSKKIALAVEKSFDCKRIGTAVIGLEVPHAHLHLVPINNVQDINFSLPKIELTHSELMVISDIIKSNL